MIVPQGPAVPMPVCTELPGRVVSLYWPRAGLKMRDSLLPDGWDTDLPSFPADANGIATRDSSGKTLNALAKNIPWFVGGSADLAHSNKTNLTFGSAGDFCPDEFSGRNVHFGVREHDMGATVNGMALSKLRAFTATFFNFSD